MICTNYIYDFYLAGAMRDLHDLYRQMDVEIVPPSFYEEDTDTDMCPQPSWNGIQSCLSHTSDYGKHMRVSGGTSTELRLPRMLNHLKPQ